MAKGKSAGPDAKEEGAEASGRATRARMDAEGAGRGGKDAAQMDVQAARAATWGAGG